MASAEAVKMMYDFMVADWIEWSRGLIMVVWYAW
jgi:hypothetical protein